MRYVNLSGIVCLAAITFLSAYTIKNTPEATCVKSIVCDGVTTTKFIYNTTGKISEIESLHGYDRFTYDKDNRLLKHEHAMDPNAISSSYVPGQKKEMFTAKNSTITLVEIYTFDTQNKLDKIRLYVRDPQFEFRSIKQFIYENNRIVKSNACDTNGVVNGYTTYAYDKAGNMINDKQYYYATQYRVPKLLCENIYAFDNKHNMNKIYSHMGEPGYRTNPNNIIKSSYILHETTFESDKKLYPQVTEISYTYNEKGYPVLENGRWEYKY